MNEFNSAADEDETDSVDFIKQNLFNKYNFIISGKLV